MLKQLLIRKLRHDNTRYYRHFPLSKRVLAFESPFHYSANAADTSFQFLS
jgi:hypothetical protein